MKKVTMKHWYVPPTPHGIKSENTVIFKVQVLYTINRHWNTNTVFLNLLQQTHSMVLEQDLW